MLPARHTTIKVIGKHSLRLLKNINFNITGVRLGVESQPNKGERRKMCKIATVATGQSVQKTSREFRERFGVNQYYAERLIRTESNYFHNQAEIDSYKEMGFEYYQFVATLDNRTSEICQANDGKKIKVSEAKAGENAPPLHPNCRSTIVPYFKDYMPETRMYRDPETGENKFIYNMPYKDWVKDIQSKTEGEKVGNALSNGKTGNIIPKSKSVNPNLDILNARTNNPYYKNCTACVGAYCANRFNNKNLEALPNKGSKTFRLLESDAFSIWNSIKSSDIKTIRVPRRNLLYAKLQEVTDKDCTYAFKFHYSSERYGHICILEKGARNRLEIYDPQIGMYFSTKSQIEDYLTGITINGKIKVPEILRVDDKEIDYKILNLVTKKRGK